MSWKRPLFALVTVVVFFGLVELLLWMLGVRTLLSERDPFLGFSQQVSVFELDREAGVWQVSARAKRRSFNDQSFLAAKPQNGLRLFSIGGSSAYGFPWGAAEAFPYHLGRALASSFPERHVESINAGAMSYGSHRLRILIHELLRYQPDLVVIYSGHNEFVERSFYSELLERPEQLDSLRELLSHSRLFSAATRLYEKIGQAGTPQLAEGTQDTAVLLGLDVQREQPQELLEEEQAEVVRRYAENLEAIIDFCEREGVGLLLSTMPSNLTGWHPNRSALPAGLTPPEQQHIAAVLQSAGDALIEGNGGQALAILDELVTVAERHAQWWYLRGGALKALGRFDKARQAYIHAKDFDSAPTRASTALNEVIRSLAAEHRVAFVDSERVVERFAPHGLPGFNLFEDYVHPKPVTHQLIAEAMWREILQAGLAGPPSEADPDLFWAALSAERPTAATLADEPLAISGEQTPEMLFNLAVVLENQGLPDQAMEKYRACLELHPGYFYARSNLGRLLFMQGNYAAAEIEYRQVVAAEPDHLRAVHGLGETYRRLGRVGEALELFQRATEIDPQSKSSWLLSGLTLIQLQRIAEAETAFRRASELDPADSNVHALLGGALLYLDRLDQAAASFQAALELDSGNIKARNGLAAVLAKRGRLDEAEGHYRESLSLDPGNAQARRGLETLQRMRGN